MKINDEVIGLLAERHLNKKEHISDWAIRCLEKGYDSKSLQMPASMSDPFISPFELDDFFCRTLRELGWDKITTEDYLFRYAGILAEEVVEGKADPIEASHKIHEVCLKLDYPSELSDWVEIDQMISDYNYFQETGKECYFYRTREELLSEIRKASKKLLNAE